jgi:hypothetical protein
VYGLFGIAEQEALEAIGVDYENRYWRYILTRLCIS